MYKIKKLIAIALFMIFLLLIIPKGRIQLDYMNNNVRQQLALYQIAEEEKQKKVAEIIAEMAKNYNLTISTDLRTKCNLFASDYDYLLQGSNLEGIGKALQKAEQLYHVNGLYLMGLCILESGWRNE